MKNKTGMIDFYSKGQMLFLVVLAMLNCIVCGCRHKEKPWQIMRANYVVKGQLTTNQDSVEVSQLVDTLLENTMWRDKARINKSYNPNYINIYLIDGSAARVRDDNEVAELLNKSSYVGYNIIFLDDAYLRTFLDKHDVTKYPGSPYLQDSQESFLYWVIGHELGHLVCGHLSGHFEAGSLDRFVKTSSLDNKQELQADSFFVQSTLLRERLRISEQRLMMDMLNAEIEHKIGKVKTYGVGIIHDYTNKQVVNYARQPTHPEYVVRLSRMLELSTKMGHDTGIYNLVVGFIKQLKEVKGN